MKNLTTKRGLRCAIYTRVSTDQGLEQDFNSLDAQREASEAYIKSQAHEGWRLVRDRYDDGGFSGGSMDRPALQKLLIDVQARRIDVIVVYKVDRLTRSLAAARVRPLNAPALKMGRQVDRVKNAGKQRLADASRFDRFASPDASRRCVGDGLFPSRRHACGIRRPWPSHRSTSAPMAFHKGRACHTLLRRRPDRDGARWSWRAAEVVLSPSPCLRRVRVLEENGIIARYAAILEASKVGMGLTVFACVYLTGQGEDQVSHFIEEIGKLSQVVECHLMAGDCDFLLRVVAEDLAGYRRFQGERLARIKGVQSIKTDIPMQMVKLSWELPLAPDGR